MVKMRIQVRIAYCLRSLFNTFLLHQTVCRSASYPSLVLEMLPDLQLLDGSLFFCQSCIVLWNLILILKADTAQSSLHSMPWKSS